MRYDHYCLDCVLGQFLGDLGEIQVNFLRRLCRNILKFLRLLVEVKQN